MVARIPWQVGVFMLGLPYNHFSNNCDCLCRHLQMDFVLFSSHFLAFAGYSHSYKSHTENPAVSQSTDFNTLRSLSGKPAIIYLLNNTLLMKCFIHILNMDYGLLRESGVRCSSVVRAFAHGAMGHRIYPSWGGPIELFLVPASAP